MIDEIKRYETNRDGQPYVTKSGKKFIRFSIRSQGKWYGGVDFGDWTENWMAGDLTSDVDIIEKEYKGNIKYEIEKPNRIGRLERRVEELEKAMRVVVSELREKNNNSV